MPAFTLHPAKLQLQHNRVDDAFALAEAILSALALDCSNCERGKAQRQAGELESGFLLEVDERKRPEDCKKGSVTASASLRHP